MRKTVLVLALPFALSACMEGGGTFGGGAGGGGPFVTLPENVLAMVGPYQDVNAVKINALDGCYEYRHIGPVETTFLPLRTKNGRPICTRAPGEEAA